MTRLDRLEEVGRHSSRGVVIDVAALDVLDSFAQTTLGNIAEMARLRGPSPYAHSRVGVRPPGRSPGGKLPWSLAPSYKRCEVVFMGAGRTWFCSQPFSGPAVTNHTKE